jgi:endonuclease YncB( thermonuclease family)
MCSNVTRLFNILNCCKGKKKVVIISPSPSTSPKKDDTQNIISHYDAEYETIGYLNSITYKDTIPFIPPIIYGKVIKVYDGDTITIAAKLPFALSPVYRFSVRLAGIDSPEMRGGGAQETALATISRDALHSLIFGKVIELRNKGKEKYGRLLADLYTTPDLQDRNNTNAKQHVNQWMLDKHYAVPYDGGKKMRSPDWD